MKAVIMAGGAGTRLQPLTDEYVKPMIPLVNKPVLDHLLNLLKRHNIFEAVLHAPIYLGHQVEIKPGFAICGPTVVLGHTVIEKGTQIEQFIIDRDCTLGERVKLQRCIVARSLHLPAGLTISDKILTARESF
jgi:NDP-sugar pyrophosphorylase family protein